MNVFGVASDVLLSVLLFWAVYHARILIAGIRRKRSPKHFSSTHADHEPTYPKFSLIVPAKDEAAVICRCVDALMNLDYPKEKLEVLLVAGASADKTRELCFNASNKYPQSVKVINEATPRGKPAALNLAFPHATGEIVGVFDADSIPERNVLKKAAAHFQDASVSAIQGNAVSLNEQQNMLTRVAATEDKAWFQGLLHGRERLGLFVAFTGSCQFIRSSVLREMGGWEESALAEDVELALKLVKCGRSVKFASDVSSGQETPFSLRELITQRTRWYRGYMEASLKYSSLLDHINRRIIDAELSLVGPFMMLICLAGYVDWALSLLLSSQTTLFPFAADLAVLLTSITLVSLGISMAFHEKPVKLKNLIWIPFIYGYWFLQTLIATKAFGQFIFRRHKVWTKTTKSGLMKSRLAPNGYTPAASPGKLKLPPLKVCIVSSYPPNCGRLSEYAKSLVSALQIRPSIAKMYLIADKPARLNPKPTKTEETGKVQVIRVWKPDDPFSILKIMTQLIQLRPDVVHFNIHFQSYGKTRIANFAGFSLTFLSRLLGFKVLVEVHNIGEKVQLEHVHLKPSFINKIGILVATRLVLSTQRVVVTVQSYVDYLKQRYGNVNVQYIPHGATSLSHKSVHPPDQQILIFGHMGPYKGLPLMLQAFSELQKHKSNIKLVVAGTNHPNFAGFIDPYVKANLPNVTFLGYVPDTELEQLFTQSDVVALPYSVATGTSGVFHLACGYGRPIVASDLPELKELVDQGASALLVPPGDAEALQQALLKVLSDENLAHNMEVQNLAFAQKENWGTVAQAYEAAYLELTAP